MFFGIRDDKGLNLNFHVTTQNILKLHAPFLQSQPEMSLVYTPDDIVKTQVLLGTEGIHSRLYIASFKRQE